MKKWEYNQLVSSGLHALVTMKNINELGSQGWELISVVLFEDELIYCFKRPKPEQQTPEVGD